MAGPFRITTPDHGDLVDNAVSILLLDLTEMPAVLLKIIVVLTTDLRTPLTDLFYDRGIRVHA
jgi:hypothetical protein